MVNDIAVQEFVNAIKEEPQDTNKTYNATVSRVDKEGIVWVNIHGSDKETPTASTSTEVKRGDNVVVNWRNNKLYIGGNYTNPSAGIGTVQPSIDYINDLVANSITVNSINAATGYIEDLTSKNITTENLAADHATIKELDVESMAAATAYIRDLTAENITADDIIADHATIDTLDSTYATIEELHSDYAEIDLANVNNAWIEHGTMKKAEVFDENVFDLSGDHATIRKIDASKINVANLRADNLIVRRINGQPVVGGYTLIDSNSSGYASKNPQALGWYEFVNAQWVLSTDTTVDMTKAYYQEGNEVSLYDQEYIDNLENGLQQQIDGAVETYTGTVVPTLVNWPYTDWYDTSVTPVHDERAKHVGDIYYVVNSASDENGYCYRFAYDNTQHVYDWVLIKDSDVTKALSDISELQTFESETTSWIEETDEGLETIRTNYTALSGRVDDVEDTANAALPASTFETFESTTFTDLVDEVDEQSTTMTNMTSRLGLNSDGTGASTDIVAKESALEQTVDGISTRVGKTETKLIGMYATSSTAAGTAAKVATITPTLPSGATWELGTGTIITVKFTNANTTSSPTLNVNSKGAKAIKTYANGNLSEAEYKWAAGSTFTFVYNGTNWLMQDSSVSVRMNSNETSISQAADSIISLASGNTTYTKPDGTTATSTIGTTVNQTANNVLIKATRTGATTAEQQAGGTSAAALINVTPDTVKIAANHVEITGSAVFNAVDADADAKAAMLNSELEIGGRNLSLATGTAQTLTVTSGNYWFSPAFYTTSDYGKALLADTSNTRFTVSYDYSITGVTGDTTLRVALRYSSSGGYSIGTIVSGENPSVSTGSSSGHVSITFEPSSGSRTYGTDWLVLVNNTTAEKEAVANATLTISNFKFEIGTKATDWTPAPEDVQAEIDAKKSVHTLTSSNAGGTTYATILGWAAEGTSTVFTVTSTAGVSVGDTVRIAYKANDMGTSGTIVYIVGTVTDVNNSTNLRITAHGLDTTVIDGGHILTGTIDANNVNISNLTVGAFTNAEQNKVLNSEVEIGGTNLIPLSQNLKSFTVESASYGPATFTNVDCYVAVTTTSTARYGIYYDIDVKASTEYTLSFNTSSVTGTVLFGVGNRSASTPDWTGVVAYTNITNGLNTKTFTVPSGCTKIRIYICGTNGSHWYVWKLKLEKGNKATDWSPATDDLAGAKYLTSAYSGPYSTYVSWVNRTTTDTYAVTSSSGVNVGDIVYIECNCTTTNAKLYVMGEVTNIPSDTQVTIYPLGIVDRATYSSKTATSYITDIDSNNGITIKAVNGTTDTNATTGNYIKVNASGMYVYQGGKEQAYFKGDAAAIGANGGNRSIMNSTGLHVYKLIDSTQTEVAQFSDTARVGPIANGYARTLINTGGMQVVQRNSSGTDITMANIGYGSGNAQSGQDTTPYYTLGVRNGSAAADIGNYSVSEGYNAKASGYASHSEGHNTNAIATVAHAEGFSCTAGGFASHAEGDTTTASGNYSHTEGGSTSTSYAYAHAEGYNSKATARAAHAEGDSTEANADYSHAGGQGTVANGVAQTVIGKYNTADTTSLFIVGKGSSAGSTSNAFKIDGSGNVTSAGSMTVSGHSSAIGDYKSAAGTSKSLTAGTAATLCTLALTAGVWVVMAQVRFPNASDTTYRAMTIKGGTASASNPAIEVAALNGYPTNLTASEIFSVGSSGTTIYLNVQAGKACTIAAGSIGNYNYMKAVRIA